ncbi:MAG: ATP-binding protein [Terriglobales bacterium]
MSVVTQLQPVHAFDDDPRFRALFEGAAIGIGICRLDGRLLDANPALSRMLGYSRHELVDAQACELYPELARQLFAETDLEVGGATDPANALDKPLLGQLLRGERDSFEVEKRYRRKDGSEFWASLTASLGRDARRQPAFLIALLADATERRRMREHLRATGKMEMMGRVAGGIAHDFNNLLTGILLYCDLLSAGLEDPDLANADPSDHPIPNQDPTASAHGKSDHHEPQQPSYGPSSSRALARARLRQQVDEVRMASEQGAALTHQLLAIARKQASEPHPIHLNETVGSLKNLLQRLLGEHIELVIALDSAAGLVLADPAQIAQVILNLALNARDAMPQGGKIWLITRPAEFPGVQPRFQSNSAPDGPRRAVSLTVKDNGCGMNAETRAHLFEPFFTTKNPEKGTGLGLATVQRIVAEVGGTIAVDSQEGRGTCIEVLLPAHQASSAAPSRQRGP